MLNCKRNGSDPLLRMFLDEYHLNLLSIPRENSAVGDLYVYEGGRVCSPGNIAFFLDSPFEMPQLHENEPMADVAGTLSSGVTFKAGFGLMEGFLTALGAAGMVTKIRVGFEKGDTSQLRYRFANATRDSVDVLQMGMELIGKQMMKDHPLYDEDNRYFLVTGVARSPSINVAAEDKMGRSIDLDLEALKLAGIGTGISIEKAGQGETMFSGKKSLAFGVEVLELSYDCEENRLELKMQSDAIKLMHDQSPPQTLIGPVFIGDEQGDAFFSVEY